MRAAVLQFVRLCESVFDLPEPVIEIGSRHPAGQENYASPRALFGKKSYLGCDMEAGPGVDRVENAEALTFETGSAGTVIFVDTAEHVERPAAAVKEIHRVLRPGGMLIMSSVMDFPIHNHPHDYWRFTPEGFRSLMSDFTDCILGWQGPKLKPHTVLGIGRKGSKIDEAKFRELLAKSSAVREAGRLKPLKQKMATALYRSPLIRKPSFMAEVFEKYIAFEEVGFERYAGLPKGS